MRGTIVDRAGPLATRNDEPTQVMTTAERRAGEEKGAKKIDVGVRISDSCARALRWQTDEQNWLDLSHPPEPAWRTSL